MLSGPLGSPQSQRRPRLSPIRCRILSSSVDGGMGLTQPRPLGSVASCPLRTCHFVCETSYAKDLLFSPQFCRSRSADQVSLVPHAVSVVPFLFRPAAHSPNHRHFAGHLLCARSARHFECGTLHPLSAFPGPANSGTQIFCPGSCPDLPPSLFSSGEGRFMHVSRADDGGVRSTFKVRPPS
ncbi:hypothetical protein NDU88_003775 [Pleurodeles waltl]|uniref:Uncharacterized protein n=1 Tax=Pleurodeles waltl TaxID=8319 RepID=A0AAV7WQ13_PLEWA|nr:hypothetical protein NDU88_003775 [Pleurodeles waltl]